MMQSAQERQFDDFALIGHFNRARFRAVLRQTPVRTVTMITEVSYTARFKPWRIKTAIAFLD